MTTANAPVTHFAAHSFLKGELHLAGPASIAGRVEGSIVAEDHLEVLPDGVVEGDIQGVLIDIHGTVNGNVVATQACRLGGSARVTGEIRAANLAIAEGACFVGQVAVGGAMRAEEAAVAELAEEPVVAETAPARMGVNRIEALAQQAEEIASEAVGAAGLVAPSEASVGVLSQNVQQTLNRAPRIIKARM